MTDDRHTRAGTGYLVAPPGGGGGPGILVLHAWWGLTPFFRDVCDRLANEGFVALAPDLHGGRTAETPDEAEALLASMNPNRAADLVLSSAATLRDLPITPDAPIETPSTPIGRSGVIGRSRSVAALDSTRSAARSASMAASSASASSGVSAVRPACRSGARATNPSSASRSHTSRKNGVSPHQACSTSTPGPVPLSGTARYPVPAFLSSTPAGY